MAQEQQTIEEQAPTVEEAVAAGLARLKLSKDKVDIKVLDEGRRGLLGIGGRDAIVRLTVRQEPASPPAPATRPAPPAVEKPAEPTSEAPKQEVKAAAKPPKPPEPQAESAESAEATSAKATIEELLAKMDIAADVDVYLSEPDDLTGQRLTVVSITGEDLGLLIGPRGETLDALQYVTRLMVGHQIRQRANFVIDIDGYRDKREQALSRLAERMGQKAIDRGSPVTLEPMPAYDRRIIHMTLRENPQVRTESTGEGNRRRVRIYPL